MTRGPLRFHQRIIVPVALVALVSTASAAFVAVSLIARTFESNLQRQLVSASAVVAQSDFAINPSILRSVKEITGADVITFGGDGRIVAGTVTDAEKPALVRSVTAGAVGQVAAGTAGFVIRRIDCGVPCYVVYRRLASRPDAVVALVADTSTLQRATNLMTRTIVAAGALSLAVMILGSRAIARRVTAPLDRLVAFTRDLSAADSGSRAPVGDDEVGRLGTAFNGMLDRLAQSQQALVRSEKLALVGVLAARVAHDIRNPLSSMKMQTQLLRSRTAGDAESQALAAAVLHDIDQLESVVRDLLQMARPGELTIRSTPVNAVVADALKQLTPQFVHRKITIETDLDAAVPAIPLDAERFKQALLNVLSNAAEAMPVGGMIAVATRREGDSVVVEVCDDGAGIDPAIRDRIFDPFVSTKRDGVGLGLVNARAVVESHGGTIALRARTPRGTQVRLTLPVAGHSTAPAGTREGHG